MMEVFEIIINNPLGLISLCLGVCFILATFGFVIYMLVKE